MKKENSEPSMTKLIFGEGNVETISKVYSSLARAEFYAALINDSTKLDLKVYNVIKDAERKIITLVKESKESD